MKYLFHIKDIEIEAPNLDEAWKEYEQGQFYDVQFVEEII